MPKGKSPQKAIKKPKKAKQ